MPRHEPNENELRELTEKADKAAALAAAEPKPVSRLVEARTRKTQERLNEVLTYRLAGMPLTQIAEKLGLSLALVSDLSHNAVAHVPKATIEHMRELENQRLDQAQNAIWDRVLAGDDKAINTFLRISTRRAALNGLDEALKIDLSIGVRQEMEAALAELQSVVLGEVISRDDNTG